MADLSRAKDMANQKIDEASASVTGFDKVLDFTSQGTMTTGALKASKNALDYAIQEAQKTVDLNLGQITNDEYQTAVAGLETEKEKAYDKIMSGARVGAGITTGINVASIGLSLAGLKTGSASAAANTVNKVIVDSGDDFLREGVKAFGDDFAVNAAKVFTEGSDDALKEFAKQYGDDILKVGGEKFAGESGKLMTEFFKTGSDDALKALTEQYGDDAARTMLNESVKGLENTVIKTDSSLISKSLYDIYKSDSKALMNVLKQNGDDVSKEMLKALKEGTSHSNSTVVTQKVFEDILKNQGDDATKLFVDSFQKTTNLNGVQNVLGKLYQKTGNLNHGVKEAWVNAGKSTSAIGRAFGTGGAILKTGGAVAADAAWASPAIISIGTSHAINKHLQNEYKEQIRENCMIMTQMENSMSQVQDTDLYQNFSESVYNYNESLTGLADAVDAGQLTDEEYNQRIDELNKSWDDFIDQHREYLPEDLRDKSMDDIHKYFGQLDQNITGNDPYMYLASQGDTEKEINKEHGYVYDRADDNTKSAAKKLEESGYNPDDYKLGLANNEFSAFFMTLNARIIQACPFVAKLEAAVLKIVDASYDKVADLVTGGKHDAKYQGQNITDIANNLVQDSSTHLAMIDANNAIQTAYADQHDYSNTDNWGEQDRLAEAEKYADMLEEARNPENYQPKSDEKLADTDEKSKSDEKSEVESQQSKGVDYAPACS